MFEPASPGPSNGGKSRHAALRARDQGRNAAVGQSSPTLKKPLRFAYGPPFANTMHFVTVPPTEAPEAIACAITGEPVDLTGYHDVQFQAKVTTIGTSVFAFALRDATSAEVMYFPTAMGISTTYTLPLASPDRCYDPAGQVVSCGGFDYTQVAEVTFGDCWFASSTLKIDLEVTSLAFLQ